jgi:nucleoside-diphosphate-sugar epimerase
MPGSKVLVLGGTGPAGICLLRELIHRNHEVVAFARNPQKIPEDVSSSPLIEVDLPTYPGCKCVPKLTPVPGNRGTAR